MTAPQPADDAPSVPQDGPRPTGEPPGDADARPRDATVVVLSARDVRLPDVLRHLEAGRTVLIVSAPDEPPGDAGS
ncbi:hypothetical protein BCD48_08480 [Pseudofrankia sp. BMG5.36]|nr:hypothetical protein BCD48_08480 [Pseudofrankia sp. BMG5.36]